ncbi:hypothetical protein WJS89_10285 [Sphingomicrobium sp. XHP0235]|uniref:hypothetical protein n=1 Tax=Sphingomicrobium aquimarinum TaxID=3133971 RepID=UPI0031FEE849
MSVAGAEKLPILPHAVVERYLTAASGWTILRPSFFAQNIETAYVEDIRRRDRIYVPAGKGKVAFVDARAIGEAAARCLLQPQLHYNKSYLLTGPVAVSFKQVADCLSSTLGHQIAYEPASIIGYLAHLRFAGQPWSQAMIQTALHVGLRFGQAENVSSDLGELIGKGGKSVFDYIRDRQTVWRRR